MNKRCLLFLLFLHPVFIISYAQDVQYIDTAFQSDNTTIESIIHYVIRNKDTIKDGPAVYYYSSGELWQTGYHTDGQNDSLWSVYYPDGHLSSRIMFRNGKRNGAFTYFFESGGIKSKGCYDNDSLTGEVNLYFDGGQINEIRQYKGNKLNGIMTGYY
ncbi:MAG TPA: hypothetical protein PKL65_14910, partial [Bacteroidales bacterium]|nr:hypothetical protein [Bacteroidales bacterium]